MDSAFGSFETVILSAHVPLFQQESRLHPVSYKRGAQFEGSEVDAQLGSVGCLVTDDPASELWSVEASSESCCKRYSNLSYAKTAQHPSPSLSVFACKPAAPAFSAAAVAAPRLSEITRDKRHVGPVDIQTLNVLNCCSTLA